MSVIKKSLTLIIIAVSLAYGIGDYYGWCDKISGRNDIENAWNRLTYANSSTEVIILKNEPIFDALHKFISMRTKNARLPRGRNLKESPSAIARIGGNATLINSDVPEEWEGVKIAPQNNPIVFLYDYSETDFQQKRKLIASEQVGFVCTLEELRYWIKEGRDSERFWVTTFLIGALSLVLAIIEFTGQQKEKTVVQKQ
jgi:hypothetical protein